MAILEKIRNLRFKKFIVGIILLLSVWIGVLSYKIIQKKAYIWLPSYLGSTLVKNLHPDKPEYPIHIIFYFVDHFEPGGDKKVMEAWFKEYPKVVLKHKDADGRYPQHTWFYEGNAFILEEAIALRTLCSERFGEVELHFHHMRDNSNSLREKLIKTLENFNNLGFLITTEQNSRVAFAFIHGNWALDNSGLKKHCGVNNELKLLSELGCFGDFTFPAIGHSSQPRKINSIYYAFDDTLKAKSYNDGLDVVVGKDTCGDLIIFGGSLSINWKDWRHKIYPSIEDGNIDKSNPPTPLRIDHWISKGISIKGQPNWIFVKIFCHGAEASCLPILLGKELDDMYTYLETKYNDSKKFILHYATAREVYNIVKAAEAGKKGDPNDYRDYLIKPYQAGFQKN